ncbi:transketolase [Candidatus Pelagibacter sp. IMCC9063]|uniref:transketolase n=1 Tax=Pelagibacter sp. (strain IMCC9063) TaxID=1002672 RepID=UPI00020465A3|nr:transketolase [Candidatus Pelagibacter sp. IMCC9063]AEA81905.1 transketolase [Candidatus Pelagibacter sp. IMCC9063]
MKQVTHTDLANAIRFLSIDAVQKANSGHPGMPMGMADVCTVLFRHFLKFDPSRPGWINRDRFVLSAGHGSMLLYALLYLTGYKSVSLNDIKNFRQLDSICAGHPEYENGTGIETTTGPLGQGIANAVGFAISEEILKSKKGKDIYNHKTYVVAGDGCLMEGISHEALSLAGHLKLKNLVMFFDNNSISIDGPTSLAVSDNYKKRLEAYGWDCIDINGHNEKQIFKAIKKCQNAKRPTVIACKTTIGFGSPNKSGKSSAHGSPLGDEEIQLVRKKLKWKHAPFEIPKEILQEWRSIGENGKKEVRKWEKKAGSKLKKITNKNSQKLTKLFADAKNMAIKETKPIATRKSSEDILNLLTVHMPELIGGSADLAGSNNTKTKSQKIIKPGNFAGSYIHYGVREHAMCGIMNGIALHGELIPYGGTFLIFSDYCKPSIRLSALMKQRVVYVMTHDSIGLGEDGPTHQPVEQIAGLRAIPNLNVFRPADTIETIECWDLALRQTNTPSVLSLTRQNLKLLRTKNNQMNKCSYGAYEIYRSNPEINLTIIATGSEVEIAVEASQQLTKENIHSKVVSMPCQELFEQQESSYKKNLLEETTAKISIEAASTMGWKKYTGNQGVELGIDTFGKSAPYKKIYEHFKLTSNNIIQQAKKIIQK